MDDRSFGLILKIMKTSFVLLLLLASSMLLWQCKPSSNSINQPSPMPTNSEVIPVDINQEGFELLDRLQGQWIGQNRVLAWDWPWFAFDYRAVSESHVFGIFEGGSMGNLLTSFFVTDYKGKRTIMARNGGLLNGIYRTSYFVLDSVNYSGDGDYYRLVDAIGGSNVMFMELRFKGQSLEFDAFTSRLGERTPPSQHMAFRGQLNDSNLAQTAAALYGFPTKNPAFDFSNGFDGQWLYTPPGLNQAVSATFMDQDSVRTVYDMANTSGDPVRIQDHSNMAALNVNLSPDADRANHPSLLFLSKAPLVDAQGQVDWDAFDSVLLFPQISAGQESFEFTYLFQGTYYLTGFSDRDNNGSPSPGDKAGISQLINLNPGAKPSISLNPMTHGI